MGEAPVTKVGRFERERRMMRGKRGQEKGKKVGNRKSVRVKLLHKYLEKTGKKTIEEKQNDGCSQCHSSALYTHLMWKFCTFTFL